LRITLLCEADITDLNQGKARKTDLNQEDEGITGLNQKKGRNY
jgi:hypothetical protein